VRSGRVEKARKVGTMGAATVGRFILGYYCRVRARGAIHPIFPGAPLSPVPRPRIFAPQIPAETAQYPLYPSAPINPAGWPMRAGNRAIRGLSGGFYRAHILPDLYGLCLHMYIRNSCIALHAMS
jgi:hypothetical protein